VTTFYITAENLNSLTAVGTALPNKIQDLQEMFFRGGGVFFNSQVDLMY